MKLDLKNNIGKLCFFSLILLVFLTLAGFQDVYALDTRLSFSDPSATVGSEFDVSMKVTSLDGYKIGKVDLMLSYDSQYLEFQGGDYAEGGAGSIKVTAGEGASDTEWSFNLKFKALQAGESGISVGTWEIYDGDGQAASLSQQGSSKITLNAGESSSTDANLSSLKIAPGILTPEFSPEVTEYTSLVGTDVEKITVSATPQIESSKVIISGNEGLVIGENRIECQVTAEDGVTSKTYAIILTKQEGVVTQFENVGGAELSSENVNLHGTEYTIASSFDVSLLPEGFVLGRYSYKGKDVAAGQAEGQDFIIMYLIAANGSGGLYSYNPESEQWTAYTKLTAASKAVTVVPLGKDVVVPEGFKESTFELTGSGIKIQGWTWASDSEERYYIFYGMNADGEKNFYRYDTAEKTIQRFFSDPAIENGITREDFNHIQEEYSSLLKDYQLRGKALIGLIILSIVLLIIIIFMGIIFGRRSIAGKKEDTAQSDHKEESIAEKIKKEENRGKAKVKVFKREEFAREKALELQTDKNEVRKEEVENTAENSEKTDELEILDFDDLDSESDKEIEAGFAEAEKVEPENIPEEVEISEKEEMKTSDSKNNTVGDEIAEEKDDTDDFEILDV